MNNRHVIFIVNLICVTIIYGLYRYIDAYNGRYNYEPWMKIISHGNLAHGYLIGHFHSTECKSKTVSVDTVDKLFAYLS